MTLDGVRRGAESAFGPRWPDVGGFTGGAMSALMAGCYHVGVLVAGPFSNDAISGWLCTLWQRAPLLHVTGLLVAFALAERKLRNYLRAGERPRVGAACALLVESAIFAGALYLAMHAVSRATLSVLSGHDAKGLTDALLIACGAGVHEELIFRAGIVGLLVWLLRLAPTIAPTARMVIAIVVSSLIFSLAHGLGTGPVLLPHLIARLVAGIALGAVYLRRGLASAIYTHAWYDSAVLLSH